MAFEWFNKAAALDDPVAQRNLGGMYLLGRGVEQSNSRAAEWFKKAADKGDEAAASALERMRAAGTVTGT